METIAVYYEQCPFCQTRLKGSALTHMWAFHPGKTAEWEAAQKPPPEPEPVADTPPPAKRTKRKGS